jgi:hypothetical protein
VYAPDRCHSQQKKAFRCCVTPCMHVLYVGPLWEGSGSTTRFTRSPPKRLFRGEALGIPLSRAVLPGATKHQLILAPPHPPNFFPSFTLGWALSNDIPASNKGAGSIGQHPTSSRHLRREAGEGSRHRIRPPKHGAPSRGESGCGGEREGERERGRERE